MASESLLGVRVNRINTIDMCRGLLFALMASTHALGLAHVDADHWLRSDLWLPNGWATVAFVVLSGYGAGFLLYERQPETARDRGMRQRGIDILAVMLVSNLAFAALRKAAERDLASLYRLDWWLGFVTLETEWTISGVLLPTGLLLLLAPRVMRGIQQARYAILAALLAGQMALSMLKAQLQGSELLASWGLRLLLTEGLGGFPVLPFLLNGCLGIWIGMAHRRRPSWALPMLALLACLQLLVFASTWLPDAVAWRVWRDTVGAVGKFGCLLLLAMAFTRWLPARLGTPIELIGRYALGSFVMHRVFMQTLAMALGLHGATQASPALAYAVLFLGTLALTWQLCEHRRSWTRFDLWFRSLAM